MRYLLKNQRGFSAIELMVVIIIVILIGSLGWLVHDANHKTTGNSAKSNNKPVATKPTTPTPSNPYSGWNSYTLKYEKLSFKYPANWTATDTSSNGIDNVVFNSNDNFSFYIEDGDSPGGDPIMLASNNPINVSFIGHKDYIVFSNPHTGTGNPPQPNIVGGAFLLTNPTDYLSYPMDKNVLNVYNSNFGEAGSHLLISMAYSNALTKHQTIQQATSDQEFANSKLLINSMKY